MYRKKNQLMELTVCLIDLVVLMISLFLAGLIRYRSFASFFKAEELGMLIGVLAVLHIAAFYFLKIYNDFYHRNRYQELLLSIRYSLVIVIAAEFLSFSMKQEVFTSRLVMGYFLILDSLFIWLVHLLIRNWARFLHLKSGRMTNLLVVTTAERLPEIMERFSTSKEVRWNIVGAVLLEDQEISAGGFGVPLISSKEEDYLEYATQHIVDEVFIQVDEMQKRENYLKSMILEFEKMGVVVNLSLDLFSLNPNENRQIYNLEQYHVLAFSSRLFDYRMVMLKRLIDIIGSLVGMIVTVVVGIILAPFLLLESPGPLIFCQKRVGVNGRIFKFYKFRSMYVDAEERKKDLMAQNEMNGLMFKMENDPRITKVGAFIRKTSIDELPQFWNVLKGDMSLVGTRPPTLDEYQQYNHYQKRRISFRPGITGLWQISGRSDIKDFDEVVKLDLEYIDNWSIWLDFKIILKTILIVLKHDGAR